MKGKTRFHWVTSLIAALALCISAPAAQRVTDNENTTNRTSSARSSAKASAARDAKGKKININTASRTDLETLPGVGPSTSDAIIAARPFKTLNDLKEVSGIGDARFKDIRPLVTVGSPSDRRASRDSAGSPARASTARSSSADDDSTQTRRPRTPQRAGQPAAETPSDGDRPRREVTTGETRRRDIPQRAGQPAAESGSRDSERRASNRNSGEKVNINTASQEELESLLGIGPVKAQAIIDNRPYEKPEDVMNVKGIKEGTYDQIRDQITVR